ncbi:MAG: rod shape-determining protein MreC [Actinobacteria bacterium]|nr:MAG: rod shape-determining protein MreC [Actinomycetota bacterium]
MYDKKVIRRRRAALAVLLGLSLILLTAYFGESPSGVLHGVQRGAQQVLAPVESGASKAFKPFSDLFNWVGDAFGAKGQNKKLKKELAATRAQLAAAQSALRENQQLRAMVGLPRRPGFPQGTNPVAARVIARSPTDWYSTISIDKGSSDGIHPDQPVVTGDGLVGKIESATHGTAQVTLITDASSAVSAQIMPDGSSGILRPAVGDPSDLQLDFIQKGRQIKKGQAVVTSGFQSSGLQSLFPRGIPIGRVRTANPSEIQTYQRVHVQAYADFGRFDYVQVLTARPPGVQAASVGVGP